MDQLESDLEAYKTQLSQVDLCMSSTSEQDEEMVALRDNIKQLISLTEQQLLEKRKQELLSMLPPELESPTPSPPTPSLVEPDVVQNTAKISSNQHSEVQSQKSSADENGTPNL